MKLRWRLERLQRVIAKGKGRCPVCQDWPGLHTSKISAADYFAGKLPPDAPCCSACGRAPFEVVEIVVESREQVAALRRQQRVG
jgi:hypothetical protein